MSAAELLAELRCLGVRLEAAGDALRYDAPEGALTPRLRDAMAEHKAELLALVSLADQRGWPPIGSCRTCGEPSAANLFWLCPACADGLYVERDAPAEPDSEKCAERCPDCGRPSPRGLTPCNWCVAGTRP